MNISKFLIFIFSITLFLSCAQAGPKEIISGKDQCDHCKMTITETKYATQLITEKGKVYKFDDIRCMQDFALKNKEMSKAKMYVVDFPTGKFIESSTATFITGGTIRSPMGGNTQAFKNKADAHKAASQLGASLTK